MGAIVTQSSSSATEALWPPARLLSRRVPIHWLLAVLAGFLGSSQILLWRFLDIAPLWAYVLGAGGLIVLCVGILRSARAASDFSDEGPSIGALVLCFIVAIIFLMLGG